MRLKTIADGKLAAAVSLATAPALGVDIPEGISVYFPFIQDCNCLLRKGGHGRGFPAGGLEWLPPVRRGTGGRPAAGKMRMS